MPVHLIFIANEVSPSIDDGGAEMWMPSFQGAYRAEYAKHFSFIGRYQIFNKSVEENGKKEIKLVRAINFGPDPTSQAKDRSGSLERWEEPNLDAIFAKLAASTISNDGE